jgi:hypothetical protein
LIDISIDRHDNAKAYAYLDGPDARLFRILRAKLGSDESAQNAIILQGLISKLQWEGKRKQIEEIEKAFPDIVGVSYAELQRIVSSI